MNPGVAPCLAVFALGGNLGDPLGALRTATAALAAELGTPRVSAVYRTEPEGGADQPLYLNVAVAGMTGRSPGEVLAWAHALEGQAGRERPYRGAPRTLDVDVVFLGDLVLDQTGLRIPHPRWSQRDFVVVPLLDIIPDFADPATGRTVREVAAAAGWLDRSLMQVVLERGLLLSETS